jgi:hypothetical protein
MAQDIVDQALAIWTTPKTGTIRELGYLGEIELCSGPLLDHVTNAVQILGELPIDSILKGFRSASGLPAPGRPLSGWASQTSERTFGQWISGLARLSRLLSDPSLAQRAADLVDGYSATLTVSGSTGMTIYGWEKLVCGLVDTFLFTGYEPASKLLSKIARAEHLDQTRALPVPTDPAGAGTTSSREWYTLPENLYRGFEATGDEVLLEFARAWHYDRYWDHFLNPAGPPPSWDIPAWLHAYSHVNSFASVGAIFEITRDPTYLRILANAHDWLVQTQCYATGGYGPAELTVPTNGSLGKALEWRTDTAEIICGSWAAFKLCSHLLRHTSDVRYLEWPEKLLYNGLLPALPLQPDGRSPYYADYRLGCAAKSYYWEDWPCCSGTYGQAFSFAPNFIYQAVDDDGVAISLFVPSRLRHFLHGQPLVIQQQTRFPDDDSTVIAVLEAPSREITIWARIPSWACHVEVRLNNAASIPAEQGTWLAIRRLWTRGDKILITFRRRITAVPVDPFHPNRVAFQIGPVVLAQDAATTTPFSAPLPLEMVDWESHFTREGEGLTFRPLTPGVPPLPQGHFRPLCDFPAYYPHRVYFDIATPRVI